MAERKDYGSSDSSQQIYQPYGGHGEQSQLVQAVPFLIAVIAVGVVLALLFAPREEETTRHRIERDLGHRFNSGRDSLEHTVKRLEKDFSDLRRRVEERVS